MTRACAADSSRVVIKSILPTFITAEAFLEGVTFALEKNAYDEEGVHGGFGRIDAKVIDSPSPTFCFVSCKTPQLSPDGTCSLSVNTWALQRHHSC